MFLDVCVVPPKDLLQARAAEEFYPGGCGSTTETATFTGLNWRVPRAHGENGFYSIHKAGRGGRPTKSRVGEEVSSSIGLAGTRGER